MATTAKVCEPWARRPPLSDAEDGLAADDLMLIVNIIKRIQP